MTPHQPNGTRLDDSDPPQGGSGVQNMTVASTINICTIQFVPIHGTYLIGGHMPTLCGRPQEAMIVTDLLDQATCPHCRAVADRMRGATP